MKAEFQADSVMMGRVISGVTLMVVTSDADIPIFAGDCCIAIKQFTKDGEIEIVSTSRETLMNLLKFVSEEKKQTLIFTPAEYPIFEGVLDRKLRAVMALFLGCDVYLKGLEGVGPKKLSDIINVKYPKHKKRYCCATLFGFLKK